MDSQTLCRFYSAVAQVIGESNVSRDPSAGALPGSSGSTAYGDPFTADKKHEPSGAVRPKTVEDVQEIVRLANQFRVALWTVSRGKNLGCVRTEMRDGFQYFCLDELTLAFIGTEGQRRLSRVLSC